VACPQSMDGELRAGEPVGPVVAAQDQSASSAITGA
jgi:hypothetical protein